MGALVGAEASSGSHGMVDPFGSISRNYRIKNIKELKNGFLGA